MNPEVPNHHHREEPDVPQVEKKQAENLEGKSDIKDWNALAEGGRAATAAEHDLNVINAIKLYPKAVFWSVIISMAVVMESYDGSLIGGFYGYPSFQKKYGELFEGGYQIPAPWQVGLGLASTAGVIVGAFANGYLVTRFGYRRTMLGSYGLMAACIFVPFFSPNIKVLLVGEILCGVPWGIFSTIAVAYASEVCPVVLRAYLASYVNICWVIGGFIGSGVLKGLESKTGEWGYRVPFAVQWVWPVVLSCITFFAPESPWWCVRQGRLEEAEKSVRRLSRETDDGSVKNIVSMMVHTNQLERETELELHTGTTYLDCFKGVDLRRTEIACVGYSITTLSGFAIGNYTTYFFEQAGLSDSDAYSFGLGMAGIGFCGTVFSWYLLTLFGRRTLYLVGMSLITLSMFLIGFLSLAPTSNKGSSWAQSVMLLLFELAFDSTVGPLAYVIAGEVSAVRLRPMTVSLARNTYNIIGIVDGIAAPYILNPTEANWRGHTGFLSGGIAAGCIVWLYFRLPETRNRTFGELDILFRDKVSARKFSSTIVDVYSELNNPDEDVMAV